MTETREFPVKDRVGKRYWIPWAVAEFAYGEYRRRYGSQQSLERLRERGGFGLDEIMTLIGAAIIRPTTPAPTTTAGEEPTP